jgi:hypothetical protein
MDVDGAQAYAALVSNPMAQRSQLPNDSGATTSTVVAETLNGKQGKVSYILRFAIWIAVGAYTLSGMSQQQHSIKWQQAPCISCEQLSQSGRLHAF